MKNKFYIYICISIFCGLILGNIFYRQYEKEQNINQEYNTYLLQLGVYSSNDELEKNIKDLQNYLVIERNNKFYVYLGISTKLDNAEKVQNVLSSNNIDVSIKRSVINDIEFISNLEQYDILLDNASNEDDIMSINEVILSSYEEMVLID